MENENYGLVVIGAGPGGYTAALEAAKGGIKTAIVERDLTGGICLNRGCIPTKVMLYGSELYRHFREAGDYGAEAGEVRMDRDRLAAKREEVQNSLRQGIESLFKKEKVELVRGEAEILDRGTVKVGERILKTERILIATGSEPSTIPVPGADLPGVVTSDGILAMTLTGIQKVLIVGGGVIGTEFACALHNLGIQVVIVEALDRMLAGMDKEISQSIRQLFKKRGIEVHLSAAVKEFRREDNGGLTCLFEEKGQVEAVSADLVLLAAGRRPCTRGIHTERLGIRTEKGRILVDENGETNVPGIYALGDVTGGVQLAHRASAQAKRLAAHFCGNTSSLVLESVPSCVYTDPEIASVGLTEAQAKEKGIQAVSAKYPMLANGKTVVENGERGFIRIVAEKDTGRFLGAQMMCGRATDMIALCAVAVSCGLTLRQLASAVYPHPTYSEGIGEAVELCMEKV